MVKAEEKAVEAMDRLKDETRMMGETFNPLMKAMHFRNGSFANIFITTLYNCSYDLISASTPHRFRNSVQGPRRYRLFGLQVVQGNAITT